MNQFLESLEIGKSGTAFIMERSGLLVSTSIEQPSEQNENVDQRLNAIDSENQIIQATAIYLRDRFGQLERIQSSHLLNFKVNGQRQFVQVLPFQDPRGLDWLIVTVLPEADFMERIHANTRITVLLCIAALIVGAAISILTARWITRPLVSLSHFAKALAQGKWDQTVKIERSGDLGELAASFNEMAHQLQTSFIGQRVDLVRYARSDRRDLSNLSGRNRAALSRKSIADRASPQRHSSRRRGFRNSPK